MLLRCRGCDRASALTVSLVVGLVTDHQESRGRSTVFGVMILAGALCTAVSLGGVIWGKNELAGMYYAGSWILSLIMAAIFGPGVSHRRR